MNHSHFPFHSKPLLRFCTRSTFGYFRLDSFLRFKQSYYAYSNNNITILYFNV